MTSSGGGRERKDSDGLPAAQTLRPDQTIKLDGAVLERYRASLLRGSLLIIDGAPADIGVHLLVEDAVIIGREGTSLVLRDGRISRRHASVGLDNERYVVRDLGSTNGTFLNDRRLEDLAELRDGDKIYLGQTVIKFTMVDQTEADYLRRIGRLAGTDNLTELVAKHRFDSLLEEALRDARAGQVPLTALMMDMDGLKAINDAHGHQMGAHTIGCVGGILGEILAGRGEACRFGGDEFCAYLPGMTLTNATLVAERIRREVEQATFSLEGVSVRATISIGLAELAPDVPDARALIKRADEALYRAKDKGRNTVSD